MSIIRPQMIMKVNLADLLSAKNWLIDAVASNMRSSIHSMGSATKKAPPNAANVIMIVNTTTMAERMILCFF